MHYFSGPARLAYQFSHLMVLSPHYGRIFDVFGPNSGHPVPNGQEVFGEKGVALQGVYRTVMSYAQIDKSGPIIGEIISFSRGLQQLGLPDSEKSIIGRSWQYPDHYYQWAVGLRVSTPNPLYLDSRVEIQKLPG